MVTMKATRHEILKEEWRVKNAQRGQVPVCMHSRDRFQCASWPLQKK